jgi:hypothetical protein
MPTQEYAASIQGVSIRVTRLDAAGNLQTGPGDSYTTSAFMRLSFTPEYEEGDEITEKGANGAVCVTFKSPDTLKRITMELAICEPDPELSALLSGGLLLRKNVGTFASANNLSVGWASPGVGDDPAGNGVAIEAWSWAVKDGKRASTRPYFHWVFPFVKLRQSGDRVIENGMLANTFQGYGLGNASFASGVDGRWEFPTAAERPYSYARTTWAPVGLNGFFTWNYVGEGLAELGTPNYAAVNSLDGLNSYVRDYAITTAGAITLNTGVSAGGALANHSFSVGDRLDVANVDTFALVTNKAATTSTVTLTLAAGHGVVVGDRIIVSIGDSAFDGTYGVATVSTNDITYAKTNAAAVTSVAVNSPSAIVTRNIFNGTFTALAGTSGTGISVARRASVQSAIATTTTLGTFTAANHGLVTGQIVTITGFAVTTTFNVTTQAITVTGPNTFTATLATTTLNATESAAATAQVTRGTAITTFAVPTTSGASVSSAVAGTSATTGYNVPGNINYNPDVPLDRVIKSNEDPTS